MIVEIWVLGLITHIFGVSLLTKKLTKYAGENENFARVFEEAKNYKGEDSLAIGAPLFMALCPYLNFIFGVLMLGITFIDSWFESFTDFWFDKF